MDVQGGGWEPIHNWRAPQRSCEPCAVEVGLGTHVRADDQSLRLGKNLSDSEKSRRLVCIFSTRSCWKYKHPQSHQGYMRLSENRAPSKLSKLHLLSPSFFPSYQFEHERFDPRHTVFSGYFGVKFLLLTRYWLWQMGTTSGTRLPRRGRGALP